MVTITVLDQGTPVHTLPIKESATIKSLGRGTTVELTDAGQSRFLQVRVQGVTGWVYSNHLIARVMGANDVRLRSEPEINPGNILVPAMVTGTRVIPTGREIDGFVSIRYLDIEGWVHGDFLGPVPKVAPLQSGVVCAKRNNVAVHGDPLEASPTIKKVPKNGKVRL